MTMIQEQNLNTPVFIENTGNTENTCLEARSDAGFAAYEAFPKALVAPENTGEQTAPITQETLVSPLPDDAPPVPGRLGMLIIDGKKVHSSARYDYCDAQGKPLFYVYRFDCGDGKKQFRPLTLWLGPQGLAWKRQAPPEPRPLYGLDRLAARPEAEVMVCEGEKAADAAARLFPSKVCITSMNGAQSPDKTDWSALDGRSITLWSDNDAAGTGYITAVASFARAAGATVKNALRPAWFLEQGRQLGIVRDELPQGWDAADAVGDGFTAANIQYLLDQQMASQGGNTLFREPPSQKLANEKPSASPAVVPNEGPLSVEKRRLAGDPFRDSDYAVMEGRPGYRDGVYWLEPSTDDDSPKKPLWLCSPLIVAAEARNTEQGNWSRLLVWHDNDGHRHVWACPAELLAGTDTSAFRRELASQGLPIASGSKARQKLVDYVLNQKPHSPERVRCVTKTGWFGGRYVLPDRVFGPSGGEGVIYQGTPNKDFSEAGELSDWQREIAARAVGNSRMVFALSCAFAGPLVDMARESGGGFQFTGETSKGKTSILMDPAASVLGHPERVVKKWRTTNNGVEALCQSRNDSVLILDDLGQADPKECGQAAYLIANGQGKARMQRDGGNRPLNTWKTLLLSSGELDLAQHMAEGGKTARGGQTVRLPSIPADAGAGHYVLEALHDQPDSRQFADTMKTVTRQVYGTAGVAFMVQLTEPAVFQEISESIREGINAIIDCLVIPKGAAPEVGRVAARFALVGFAGELATRFGITGWPPGEAVQAASRCFTDWLIESDGAMGADHKAIFAQVSAFLQAHANRFPPHDITDVELRRVSNRAGFSRRQGENLEYWVESGAFKNELCKGYNMRDVVKLLKNAGWLKPGTDRNQQKHRIPALGGDGMAFYVITDKAIGGDL